MKIRAETTVKRTLVSPYSILAKIGMYPMQTGRCGDAERIERGDRPTIPLNNLEGEEACG